MSFEFLPHLVMALFGIVALVLAFGMLARFREKKREMDAGMREEEARFEERMLREAGLGPASAPAHGTAPGGGIPRDAPLGRGAIATVGAKETPHDGASGNQAEDPRIQSACSAIERLQPSARQDGVARLPVQLEGRQVTLADGRRRCLIVPTMPSPEGLREALRRYDAVCVAQDGADPVIIQRLPDYLL